MSTSGRCSLRDHYSYPSFSSTLLEEIYRSFDEENEKKTYNRMKKSNSSYLDRENRFIVDRWIEDDNLRRMSQFRRPVNYSTSTSSSDSSSGFCGFSDTDSSKSKPPALKPIRTAINPSDFHRKSYSDEFTATKKKKEGNLQRRALKLYGDLKKVKQPISPGGKLATFINSLFNAGASKKSKNSSIGQREFTTTTPSTTSRSCLSKTPSSAGRFERRSVRFVDGDVATKRDSSLLANDEDFKLQIREKQRRVEQVAKELLMNFHIRKDLKVNIISDNNNNGKKFDKMVKIRTFDVDFEEEDDDLSCCSSDLFELENLLDMDGVKRYREELPVYETTHVHTNRAIANGFIL